MPPLIIAALIGTIAVTLGLTWVLLGINKQE